MDNININVAIYSWITFWLTYWIIGGSLSWYTHRINFRKMERLGEVVTILLINMFWSLFGVIFLCFMPLRALTDSHVLLKFILSYFLTDLYFYHVHIMLHHPQLYSKIHKMHHTFQNNSYALIALYCTPYEAVVLNVFSVALGPVIFQIPAPYIYLWFSLVAFNTIFTHSGLTIPYLIENFHDLHHKLFTYNYGTNIYLDWIYGTYYSQLEVAAKLENLSKDSNKDSNKEDIKDGYNLKNFPIDFTDLSSINTN